MTPEELVGAHRAMVHDARSSGHYDAPVALRGYSEGVEHGLERAEAYREAVAPERRRTGPEHYREAERALEVAGEYLSDSRRPGGTASAARTAGALYAKAQVHATLALAAATALGVTTTLFGGTVQLTEWADITRNTNNQKGSPA